MKKLNSTAGLVLAFVFALAVPAFAQTEADYVFDAGTGTITKYSGWDTELVIPAVIGGKPVTAIGDNSFSGVDLTAVTIPRGATTIGKNAFSGNKLTTLTLPNSLVTIGESAFSNNSLTSVTIPGSVKTIGESAFQKNQLAELVISEGVTTIEKYAFMDNKLASVSLPATLASVDGEAFYSPYYREFTFAPASITLAANITLDLINLLDDAAWFNYIANGRQAGTYTPGMPCEEKKSGEFTYMLTQHGAIITKWAGNANRLRVPADFEGAPVKALWYGIYEEGNKEGFARYATLDNVLLPEGLTYIGYKAFQGDRLAAITIPNSVTYIGELAFSDNQLTSLTIPNNVTYIGPGAFNGNQLTSVRIPNSVTHIGNSVPDKYYPSGGAFAGNQLTSITIANGVIYIGEGAFSGNQLTSVTIPNSVTHIGDSAFSGNQLASVTLANSVTSIGNSAFSENKLTRITIPNSVTHIGVNAFPFDGGSNDYVGSSNEGSITTVIIGANVEFQQSYGSYGSRFVDTYVEGGKRSGTYTFVPNRYGGGEWVRR